ncbi:MAG: ATP-binding cassette domain-containing protein [Betaproteobacteria bacterium]|jgi:putative ABC transport system ATP-binding protein|nr:ATP-binding cassette domain-containing protein [Betaproteobacteria bacterium]MDH5285536.1 ATP-binding cassette domain-containing protein [Betaproteobacteria bacterium]
MFELTDVEHRYGTVRALAVPSWRAQAGEQWLLAGASGSGKSTLLHILAGLTTPSAGRVVVAGQDLAALAGGARDRWRGRHVGVVPQKLHLIGAVSVFDNLRLACTMAGLRVEEARIRALLAAVQVADLAQRRPGELSQGQAQRVAIARAVVNRPALLLADEPTASLDDASAAAALELLRTQAREAGATLVVASHDARVRPLLPRTYQLSEVAAAA